MNSFDQSWTRLTAAARAAAERDAASPAPAAAWVTRVAALGASELKTSRAQPAWAAWAMPSFGVAMLVAIVAVVALKPSIEQPSAAAELVALADPLAENSLVP